MFEVKQVVELKSCIHKFIHLNTEYSFQSDLVNTIETLSLIAAKSREPPTGYV